MANYIFGYHGRPITPGTEQDGAMMAAWGAWFKGMGPALLDIGKPAAPSKVLGPSGAVHEPDGVGLTGYTIVEADSLDGALALAKGCPIFAAGGSVEVAELVAM